MFEKIKNNAKLVGAAVIGLLGLIIYIMRGKMAGQKGLIDNLATKEKDLELKGQQQEAKAEIKAELGRQEDIKNDNADKGVKDAKAVEDFWNKRT